MYLKQIEINKIVSSDEFNLDDSVKNFIRYKNGKTVKPLCLILSQMRRVIKFFENSKKNMSFLTDNDVILKCNKIWKKLSY